MALSEALGELPEDQVKFLKNYEELIEMLPWESDTEEYHQFHDRLSNMLAQANTWGREQATADKE